MARTGSVIASLWCLFCAIIIGFTLWKCTTTTDSAVDAKKRKFIATHDCRFKRYLPGDTSYDPITDKVVVGEGLMVYECTGIHDSIYLWTKPK